MGIFDLFKRKPETETRASGTGYTSEAISARQAYITGRSGLAELTSTAQACVSLWEGALSLADVKGTDLLDRARMGMLARSLALRGEAVMLIEETGLVPASDWDLSTRNGLPRAYRLSIPEAGGGTTRTALSAEVLHVRIGCDHSMPWLGTAPLKRAQLTAELLHALESSLAETYSHAPLGSQIVAAPEMPGHDMEKIGQGFRGSRGKVLLVESVNVSAAGGPTPQTDWKPSDVSPDLSKSMTRESLAAARHGILSAIGVLPGMFDPNTTGPLVRESQRACATWTLQPIAALIAEEASRKLGGEISLDVMRPLQAFDAGARARAVSQIVGALAVAKGAGIDEADVEKAMRLVDWRED